MKKAANKIRAFVLALSTTVAVSVLGSCASTGSTVSTAKNLSSVYVTNTNKIKVLMPEYMGGEIDSLYIFSADFGSQSLSALSYFFSDQTEMSLTLLSDFGPDIGHLNYDGTTVDFVLPVKAPIKGEYIVADLQNIFYPADCLSENYSAAGLVFESTSMEDGSEVRTISSKNKPVEKITIKYSDDKIPNEVVLENTLRGYSYTLEMAEE